MGGVFGVWHMYYCSTKKICDYVDVLEVLLARLLASPVDVSLFCYQELTHQAEGKIINKSFKLLHLDQ